MDDTELLILILILVAVAVVAVIALLAMRAKRRKDLQSRFGPEYDRTIDRADSPRHAERDLRERAEMRDRLDIRDLRPAERERYHEEWRARQAAFVDRPTGSLAEADDLVRRVMRDRGYPVDDFEQQADLVSVDHPEVVQHYRAAHDIHERSHDGEVSTEEQRRAVVHYRALFEDLMSPSDHGADGRHDEMPRDERSRMR